MWQVYILIKDNKPVYVGCTSSISKRLSQHRRTKSFDSHFILKTFKNKREALSCENGIISFLSLFPQPQILNARIDILDYYGQILFQ